MRGSSPSALMATIAVAVLSIAPPAQAAEPEVVTVASFRETVPVTHSGDAADDPAIWVHPEDPSLSLVIGNDKRGALESYDLQGALVQRLTSSRAFWGNVDVRGNRVAVYHNSGIRIWRIDPETRLMSVASEAAGIKTAGEGLCMYAADGRDYVFAIARTNGSVVRQFELVDPDGSGLLSGVLRRSFTVGSEAEGCAVDDQNGALYIAEEDRGLWRYAADPASGAARTLVDSVVASGGRIRPDAEGVTVAGDRVIVSAQWASYPSRSYFLVYTRSDNEFVGAFRVGDGPSSDDCDGTDGIAAHAGPLGPDLPHGVFVCQDGQNHGPNQNQDFKYVQWELVP